MCSKFTGEHPCQSVISISCFSTLLKTHFRKCVLLYTLRTPFHKNIYGGLLVYAAWLIYIPRNHTCFYHLHCFGYCNANFQQNLKAVSSGKFLKIHCETNAVELSFLLNIMKHLRAPPSGEE